MVIQCPEAIDARNFRGKTPLMDACENKRLDIVQILLTHHASIDIKDNEGKTALSYAAEKNHVESVKLLLAHGADPSAPTWERPLAHLAASQKSPELTKLLLANPRFDYTALQQWGISGLGQAIFYHHNEVAKLFLQRDKDNGYKLLNQGKPNNWWHTPMMDAAQTGNSEMVKALLETGRVDLNMRSKEGKTARDLAREKGKGECERVLEQAERKVEEKVKADEDAKGATMASGEIAQKGVDVAVDVQA
jgi:ankyrin repeat protein